MRTHAEFFHNAVATRFHVVSVSPRTNRGTTLEVAQERPSSLAKRQKISEVSGEHGMALGLMNIYVREVERETGDRERDTGGGREGERGTEGGGKEGRRAGGREVETVLCMCSSKCLKFV